MFLCRWGSAARATARRSMARRCSASTSGQCVSAAPRPQASQLRHGRADQARSLRHSEDDDDAPVPAPAAPERTFERRRGCLARCTPRCWWSGGRDATAGTEVKEEEEPSDGALAPPPGARAAADGCAARRREARAAEAAEHPEPRGAALRPRDVRRRGDGRGVERPPPPRERDPLARRRRRAAEQHAARAVVRRLDDAARRQRGALGDVAAARQAGAGQEATQLFVRHKGAIFPLPRRAARGLVQPTSTKSETHKALTKQIAKCTSRSADQGGDDGGGPGEEEGGRREGVAPVEPARLGAGGAAPAVLVWDRSSPRTSSRLQDDESQLEGNLGGKRGQGRPEAARGRRRRRARTARLQRARSNRSQSERDEFEDEDEEDEEDAWDEEEKRAAADGEMDDFIVGASFEEESAEESDEEEYGKKKKKGKKKAQQVVRDLASFDHTRSRLLPRCEVALVRRCLAILSERGGANHRPPPRRRTTPARRSGRCSTSTRRRRRSPARTCGGLGPADGLGGQWPHRRRPRVAGPRPRRRDVDAVDDDETRETAPLSPAASSEARGPPPRGWLSTWLWGKD